MWIAFALGSAVLTAVVGTLIKVGAEKVDPTLAVAIQASVLTLVAWIVVIAGRKYGGLGDIGAKSWLLLAAAGVATMVAYGCYFKALAGGPSSGVQPVDRLSLIFALALAALFLRERLSPLVLTGGTLMAIGAVMIAFGSEKR